MIEPTDLATQAAHLRAEADKLDAEHKAQYESAKESAISQVHDLIAKFGLHAGHIRVPAHPAVKKGLRKAKPTAAKFKGPEGKTWSGRGRRPVWFSAATPEAQLAMRV